MDGSCADVAAGDCWLPGNDWGAARECEGCLPDFSSEGSHAGHEPRGGPGHGWPGCRSRGLTWAGGSGPARVARGPGAPGWKGAFGLMRWWRRLLLALSRRRPQAQGRTRPGQSARPDLTARDKSSVDGACPGRQASGTCPPARDPAMAEELGRSLSAATARGSRWPPGQPRPPRTITWPGAPGRWTGRCLPRQAGRTITRQVPWQARPAGPPAGPGGAGGAGQRRNIPAGANRD
jgi:hypothetical protein